MFRWLFGPKKPANSSKADGDPLLAQRVIIIRGYLTEELGLEVIKKLLYLQYENQREPIHLRIDSPGGSVTTGLAIVDTMKALAPPVHTRCDADAHGIAAVILACGEQGERVVASLGSVTLTPITSDEAGTAAELDLERMRQDVADIIGTATKRSPAAVASELVTGRFFEPARAVEYGLADRVAD